jgi:hypothetical protein
MPIEAQEEIRGQLYERLRLDLLGPVAADEVLRENKESREGDSPLSRYLLGILYPANALVGAEDDDFANDGTSDDEDDAPEVTVPIAGMPKLSSIGLSFAVTDEAKRLKVEFRYGVYGPTIEEKSASAETGGQGGKPTILWQRTQVAVEQDLDLSDEGNASMELPSEARGEWLVRRDGRFRVVSIFLRNKNEAQDGPDEPERCLFQPEILVRGIDPCPEPFVNRALRENERVYDPDLESYRLLYRDKPDFAVGHGCAAGWESSSAGANFASLVRTELLPFYVVTSTEAKGGVGLPGLTMERLANAASGKAIALDLTPLLDEYAAWIAGRRGEVTGLPRELQSKASEHLDDCDEALRRMKRGLSLIASDPLVFEAFQFANRAMMLQRIKSVEAMNFQKGMGRIFDASPPVWHPFQVAFLLLNLEGIAIPESPDRNLVDLLWFPTGGGKTEAYLGLAAFVMALRRIRHTTARSAAASADGGVTVLMRYTLRLLTIQQFQRASTMICACETLRRKKPDRLGKESFSIGLWVGGGATPNHIDQTPDPRHGREPGALQALANFDPANEPDEGNPVQLRSCPWCGEALSHENYRAIKEVLHLQIRCPNAACEFHGSTTDLLSGIPALVVDEDIYLRCPTLLVGTMDKVARLPWDERTKALFGSVDRFCQRHGYLAQDVNYVGCGTRHNKKGDFPATEAPSPTLPFLPPELIIQDELHLVTGPLGSLMGLYESAVDFLASASGRRPKIVASTATIRRYRDQIRGIFDRDSRQFPPPGLIAGDSFFAAENKSKPGRLYVGLCAPGKSMKTAAIRAMASMMHTAAFARKTHTDDDVDPYWTLVNYYNSLRELGGAIRMIDDDVDHRLKYLARQEGMDARRPEHHVELTSRVPAKVISQRLKEMERTLANGDALDALLATNMISVGVDIQRFGLMFVTGQPKTSAEYIQATSRVGRRSPGFICVLSNWSRPRDLSHYERFRAFHSMMYRHVEAGSVTPYSSRARDKALHGIFIGLIRLLAPQMSGNDGAQRFNPDSPVVKTVTAYLLQRIEANDPDELEDARAQLQALIDGWLEQIARHGGDLKYRSPGFVRAGEPHTWLMQAAEDEVVGEFPKPVLNSLRDVEKTSGLYFKSFIRHRGR